MILVIVALIMIVMAMVMPWYSIKAKVSASGISSEAEFNYFLDHSEMKVLDETQTTDYDDDNIGESEALNVFKTTQIFVYLGLVGCIMGLIGAVLVMTEKMSNKIGSILVIVALILAILAPVYMMLMLPGAFNADLEDSGGASGVLPSGITESFFGSQEQSESGVSTEYSWGGSTGWLLAFIAAIMLIVALILVGRSSPEPLPMAPMQPGPQAPYQPQYSEQPYTPQGPPPQQPPSQPPTDPSYPPPPPPPR
jgi:hypothetical protein